MTVFKIILHNPLRLHSICLPAYQKIENVPIDIRNNIENYLDKLWEDSFKNGVDKSI